MEFNLVYTSDNSRLESLFNCKITDLIPHRQKIEQALINHLDRELASIPKEIFEDVNITVPQRERVDRKITDCQ